MKIILKQGRQTKKKKIGNCFTKEKEKKKAPKMSYHFDNDLNKSKSTFPGKWLFDFHHVQAVEYFSVAIQKQFARVKSNGRHLIDDIFETGCR